MTLGRVDGRQIWRRTMNISFASAGLAGLLLAATAADASAWTRHTTVNTWRGTYTVNAAGGCGGGVCSRTRTVTGPYGGTGTQSRSVVRTRPGPVSHPGPLPRPH